MESRNKTALFVRPEENIEECTLGFTNAEK